MSIVTKKKILEKIKNGEICFSPSLDKFQVKEHAIDLRLGFTFMIPKVWHMTEKGRLAINTEDTKQDKGLSFDIVELEEGQYFELLPNEYVFVSILEKIKMPDNLMAVLYPRTSINRKGISTDVTGTINAGYEGQLILPLKNNSNIQTIKMYPGERICQIVINELTEKVIPYDGKYNKKDVIEKQAEDKGKEISLLHKGKIKELKEKFKI